MRRLVPALALVASAAAPAACTDLEGDTLDPNGKISTNGLVLDEHALAALDPAPLGDGWLAPTEIALSPDHARLASTPEGRELLQYVATCALPAGETLIVESPGGGAVHEMPGLAGLAPEWAGERCDGTCQRWISACLLAHANGQDEPVEISLRAEHPALGWSEAIAAEYDVEEAAYYGNLFAARAEKYACIGRGLFDGTWAGQTSYLEGRVCGVNGSCGLEQTGTCHSITGELIDTATCERGGRDGEVYGDCHTEARNQASPRFAEVVTVYLAR
jgi:hypothetical protein